MNAPTLQDLERENAELREQLGEAENVLLAIQRGEIDALVVSDSGADRERVFTLQGADHPYRVLVESMSEGAATLSSEGVILYANPRLAAMLSTPRGDLTGTRLCDWAAPPHEHTLERMVRSSRSEPVSGELSLQTRSGVALPVQASLSPLLMDEEHFCCAIITDQSLARHHEALEEAAQRIREANDRLREADQRKDQFLATLAHELRNPLAPIRNAAHVIKSLDYDDGMLEQARQMIDRQVTHMSRLVDDLLELSRITLGRLRLKRKTESLTEILSSVMDGARSAMTIEQDLSVSMPAGRLPINGDVVRISQAISNVVENAVKYTPPDGKIDVRLDTEDGQAVIRIRDTGIGISAGALPRIFEMFEQEAREERRGYGGLGIGLALTRSIVELHGGNIDVVSPGIGQGSEFTIRLPLDPVHRAEERPAEERASNGSPQGILIVDDNVDAAESLRMSLELSGHQARSVHAGNAALAVLDEFHPDLILLDIGLPDIDGYEVARRLRERCGAACPTLVALSGWGREEDKKRAIDAGIDAYLTKPIHPSVIARLVADNANRKLRRSSDMPGPDYDKLD